jgi:hypothetical protein
VSAEGGGAGRSSAGRAIPPEGERSVAIAPAAEATMKPIPTSKRAWWAADPGRERTMVSVQGTKATYAARRVVRKRVRRRSRADAARTGALFRTRRGSFEHLPFGLPPREPSTRRGVFEQERRVFARPPDGVKGRCGPPLRSGSRSGSARPLTPPAGGKGPLVTGSCSIARLTLVS